MALSKVTFGDVFKVQINQGFGVIQCVKDAIKTEIEVIRVIQGIYNSEADVSYIVSSSQTLFYASMPLKYALKEKMVYYIGNYPIPRGFEAPKYFRCKHMIRSEFLGWHIVDRDTLQRKLVLDLSDEEKKLSPWGTISIPDLVERLENDWTPEGWK